MDYKATARRVALRWKLLAEFVGTGLMIFLALSPEARVSVLVLFYLFRNCKKGVKYLLII